MTLLGILAYSAFELVCAQTGVLRRGRKLPQRPQSVSDRRPHSPLSRTIFGLRSQIGSAHARPTGPPQLAANDVLVDSRWDADSENMATRGVVPRGAVVRHRTSHSASFHDDARASQPQDSLRGWDSQILWTTDFLPEQDADSGFGVYDSESRSSSLSPMLSMSARTREGVYLSSSSSPDLPRHVRVPDQESDHVVPSLNPSDTGIEQNAHSRVPQSFVVDESRRSSLSPLLSVSARTPEGVYLSSSSSPDLPRHVRLPDQESGHVVPSLSPSDTGIEQNAHSRVPQSFVVDGAPEPVDRAFSSNPYADGGARSDDVLFKFTIQVASMWWSPITATQTILNSRRLQRLILDFLVLDESDSFEKADVIVKRKRPLFYKCAIRCKTDFQKRMFEAHVKSAAYVTQLSNQLEFRHSMELVRIDVVPWVGPFMRFRSVHIGGADSYIYRSSAPHFYTADDFDGTVTLTHADARALISSKEGADVGAILSFISVDIADARAIYQGVGITQYLHIPVGDFNTLSVANIYKGIKFIQYQRNLGHKTLIYCGYGDGRTGTFLAAYEALLLMESNPEISLEQVERYVWERNTLVFRTVGGHLTTTSTHGIENVLQIHGVLDFCREHYYHKSRTKTFFGLHIDYFCCC